MKIDYKWTVAKEGYLPIFISIFSTWLATAFLGLSIFSLLIFIILLLIIYFFRDPERFILSAQGIICPADGKIITIDNSIENEFTKSEMTRACIFLSVFDCHINRSPDKVKVIETRFYPGAFFFANSARSIENERLYIHLRNENDEDIVMILYAGFVARRIVPYIKAGDSLEKAQRIGIIKFGSRVDIYVPKKYSSDFKDGDDVVASETLLFKINEK